MIHPPCFLVLIRFLWMNLMNLTQPTTEPAKRFWVWILNFKLITVQMLHLPLFIFPKKLSISALARSLMPGWKRSPLAHLNTSNKREGQMNGWRAYALRCECESLPTVWRVTSTVDQRFLCHCVCDADVSHKQRCESQPCHSFRILICKRPECGPRAARMWQQRRFQNSVAALP